MYSQNEYKVGQYQSDQETLDEGTFLEWKNELEKTLPRFWESIHDSKNNTMILHDSSFLDSLETFLSRKRETMSNWIPYHPDGFQRFNFLK